jgi:CBS domain containing-hemolysin-like protein
MSLLNIALVVILAICILLSGFFSGSETAIVGLPRERMPQIALRGTRGIRLANLVADIEGTLGTLLVANNFVNILGASVATTLAIDLITSIADRRAGDTFGPWASTLVVTAVILVVGEITPKTLAARRPEQFAMFVAPTIWWLGKILEPVATVFIAISRRILRLFGVDTNPTIGATEEDIVALALLSEEEGHIDPAEREILESLFELADRPVKDVMTPRLEVVSLDLGSKVEDAHEAVARFAYSRYPVVAPGGSIDDTAGILYVKDILGGDAGLGTIDEYLREPVYIPESTPILATLQQLRQARISFGLVLDEHGGVEGIVTVKDLVSELVGDIQDEYDPDEPAVHRLGDRVWMIEGRVPVEEMSEEVGIEFPTGPYSSAAGLYLAVSGSIPEVGDVIEIEGTTLSVVRMDKRRIDRMRLEVPESTETTPPTAV